MVARTRFSVMLYYIDCLVSFDFCFCFCGLFAFVEIIDSIYSSDSNLTPSVLTGSLLKQYKAGSGLFALQMVRCNSADKGQ